MAIDIVAWHDRTSANHQAETDKYAALGYRGLSLALYGAREDPRYAAVMVKRPVVHAAEEYRGMSAAQFQKTFDTMAAKKFGPYLVAATGPANNPLFAAIFRPMDRVPLTRFGITAAELAKLNYDAWINGLIPVSIDAYGSPGDVRFIATWHPNTRRVGWNLDAVSWPSDLATRQARFNAITAQGARPTFVTMVPGGQFLGLFVDNQVGSWSSRSNLTSADYQKEFDAAWKAGRQPIAVAAEGSGAGARFCAIFADREEPVGRVWNARGPSTVAGIDAAVKAHMQAHGIRAASLAITRGTRLVYAKGYSWAEPGYPVTEPTTPFRVASVSKMFAAAAIYRLEQQGVKTPDGATFTLDTTMQSILKLKTPTGGEPVDKRFGDVTVRHLLESTSSINQWLIWANVEAAQAHGSALPCTPEQLAAYAASVKLGDKNPGDTTNVVYGNFDYFLLSQVVRVLAKTGSFEAALAQRILSPLGITRVRGSRSLQADQYSDEARYHEINIDPVRETGEDGKPAFKDDGSPKWKDWPASLCMAQSCRTPDRPLVPHAYGGDPYEIFDGCGGLSGAATDIARLVAALSQTDGNPVFSAATLEKWFRNTVKATDYTGPDDHGVHGFDWGVFNLGTAQPLQAGNFRTAKGGWLPSHGTYVEFTSGGYGWVYCSNDGGQNDVRTNWFDDPDGDGVNDAKGVRGITQNNGSGWAGVDLFDQFGMGALTAAVPATPAPPAPAPAAAPAMAATLARVRSSVEVQRAAVPAARPRRGG